MDHIGIAALRSFQPDWALLLWLLAALTMTVGNVVAIAQSNLKRMLAYSSIAHVGYMLVGLVAGGPAGAGDVARAALVGVVAAVLCFATYQHWHGGFSVGPRYLAETEPLLLVVLGMAWPSKARVLAVVCFGVLLPYCAFVQAVAAYSAAPMQWNADRTPDGIAALWDFYDNPIAHAFR